MRRTLLASALSICFALVVTTFWLLALPTPAYAATGSADCGNGYVVHCKADDCECEDGVGCTATNEGQPGVFTGCIGPKPDQPGIAVTAQ